jgi:hypothetical protein
VIQEEGAHQEANEQRQNNYVSKNFGSPDRWQVSQDPIHPQKKEKEPWECAGSGKARLEEDIFRNSGLIQPDKNLPL